MTDAKLLEGKVLAAKIQEEIKAEIEQLVSSNQERPKFVAIQVAHESSSDWYITQQKKISGKLGIEFHRHQIEPEKSLGAGQKALVEYIRQANKSFHGVFVAMPLPANFNSDEALLALDFHKDVEGIHPASLGLIMLRKSKLIPPTAYASFKLIELAIKELGKNLRGMIATIIGQSAIVGRPLQLLLGEQRVTTAVCNTGTSAQDLEKFVSEADIVVACAGQPGLVKGAWIKPGAVVIDVGTTEVNGKLVGDVEFEEAKKRAGFITPVPGGVGPLTVTMLMQNLMHAYRWQKGL